MALKEESKVLGTGGLRSTEKEKGSKEPAEKNVGVVTLRSMRRRDRWGRSRI